MEFKNNEKKFHSLPIVYICVQYTSVHDVTSGVGYALRGECEIFLNIKTKFVCSVCFWIGDIRPLCTIHNKKIHNI